MGHVVLLGDSIFDNARYVPDQAPVIGQVQQALPAGWTASLLAVDGGTTVDIATQIKKMPHDATHLIVSAGGNDALGQLGILIEPVGTVEEALVIVEEVRRRFRQSYHSMLGLLAPFNKPMVVCTVYDLIPGLRAPERAALSTINEIILREAFAAQLPVIDLRLICDQPEDYSHISSIEPSIRGGAKIARAIVEVATRHDFTSGRSTIFLNNAGTG